MIPTPTLSVRPGYFQTSTTEPPTELAAGTTGGDDGGGSVAPLLIGLVAGAGLVGGGVLLYSRRGAVAATGDPTLAEPTADEGSDT